MGKTKAAGFIQPMGKRKAGWFHPAHGEKKIEIELKSGVRLTFLFCRAVPGCRTNLK
jgi:hypothetical protein